MIPVLAIVGRPNVGKSTLFNCLTRSRQALVADSPGVTRDRNYGTADYNDHAVIVVDTGGIGSPDSPIDELVTQQVNYAIGEATIILFVVDAKTGLTSSDEMIAEELRRSNKSIRVVVNKIDGLHADSSTAEFHSLALGKPFAISATQRQGVDALLEEIFIEEQFEAVSTDEENETTGIKLAIVGRPNVGKSTLVNRMLGEERVIVCDEPGTTRDSIFISLKRRGKQYTLIDTAGVRRRSRVNQAIEKFSVIKTLQAIEKANVVIYVIDGSEAITDQDLHLIGCVLEAGRGLVIAINKCDGLEKDQKQAIERDKDRKLQFVTFAKCHSISALHGTGVGKLFDDVEDVYRSCMKPLKSSELTKLLHKALEAHQPPMVAHRRIKLRYANPGGHNPPVVVIHGNQTDSLPSTYKRYLENFFRKKLRLVGTPIRLIFKSSDNPYSR